jgi:hypothetical protein
MLTIADLVDRIEPYLKQSIETELPFGTRWVALKIARWKIRKVIETQIAIYGHHIAPVLGSLLPIGERLFRDEITKAARDIKSLCELPVADFGEAAVEARISAGAPTDPVERSAQIVKRLA